MRVVSVDARRGLATCVGDDGAVMEVDTLLVDPAAVGERLLVHARVAIARLDDEAAA
jgi:hydrogenase maturation factor